MMALLELLRYELFRFGDMPVTVAAVGGAVMVVASAIVISILVERMLRRAMERRNIPPGTRMLACRLFQYGTWVLGLVVALELLGIDLAAALAASALLFVGIGLAFQKMGESVISGFLLLGEREIEPGDVIVIDGELLKVERI
ncbi:MAG: hypothetical protein AAFX99_34675, partial [Myxococcota bacterium]